MKRSFRAALIDTMLSEAEKNSEVVILNADSARALKLTKFKSEYPDRMIGIGISEADMVTTAAGLATTGVCPVVVGFAMFVAEKPFEQIRQAIAYPNLNVKIIATHSGLCVGQDGATHQALEDMAVISSLPNFKVYTAADVNESSALIRLMLSQKGPAYLRLGRDLAEDIYQENKVVVPGGSDLLKNGSDVTIIACGLMVEQALIAADILEKEDNIKASVINAYSVKPLDEKTILEDVKKTGAVVTVEDHSVIGGLGAAVAALLGQNYPAPIEIIGVNDCFGESGTQDELYGKYGLNAKNIADRAKRVITRKGNGR